MLGIVSCGSNNAGTPVPTATPTENPVPPTATPTETPIPPTETPVPPTVTPTDTPVPTETPTTTPTDTPIPTETPAPPETPKTAVEREEQMTQDEFKSAVMGKDAQGVIAAVGKPHEITTSAPYTYWDYYLLTTSPITGDVDEMAQVEFTDGIVSNVKFD
jgi:hypothetical protein